MKYDFIEAEKAKMTVVSLCRALNISRSGYYDWRAQKSRPPTARAAANAKLARRVIALHKKSGGRYGRPKLLRLLRREGIRVGENRLRRIMVQHALWGRKRRRYRNYDAERVDDPAPNLLERNFTADSKNRVWCGDITQFRIGSRWLYVATVIDLFSRRVVGLSFGDDATTDLVVRAMLEALKRRKPPHGVVFHTDRGAQYRSARFRRLSACRGVVQSMSRGGNCLDNAVAESFFSTLEFELASRTTWSTSDQAEREIRNFVFDFYNQERIHSTLDYVSPAEFEQQQAR